MARRSLVNATRSSEAAAAAEDTIGWFSLVRSSAMLFVSACETSVASRMGWAIVRPARARRATGMSCIVAKIWAWLKEEEIGGMWRRLSSDCVWMGLRK